MEASEDITHVIEYMEFRAEREGRNSKRMKDFYQAILTPAQKAAFKKLDVNRQMYLLCVPTRAQKTYKLSGVDGYLEWQPQRRNRHAHINVFTRANDKMVAKAVARGNEIVYEDSEMRGNKNY